MATFGAKIRQLRKEKKLSQKQLAAKLDINFTYLSKVECQKLDFASYPSEALIRKLAVALDADEVELLLLAKKIPEHVRRRILERPDFFLRIATLDDASLDEILIQMNQQGTPNNQASCAHASRAVPLRREA